MNIWFFIFIAVYILGFFTVKWLDKILPEEIQVSSSHYLILFFMWIATPLLIVLFIFNLLFKAFKK